MKTIIVFSHLCRDFVYQRPQRLSRLAPFYHVVFVEDYDHVRARNVVMVKAWPAGHDIVLAGRYSEWEYHNSDHAFLAGKRAAEAVAAELGGSRQSSMADVK